MDELRQHAKQNEESLQQQLEEEQKRSTRLFDERKSLEMQVESSQKRELELQLLLDEVRQNMKKNEEALRQQFEEERNHQALVHDDHIQKVSTCKFGYCGYNNNYSLGSNCLKYESEKTKLQLSLDELRQRAKQNEESLQQQLEEEQKHQNLVDDDRIQDVSINSTMHT